MIRKKASRGSSPLPRGDQQRKLFLGGSSTHVYHFEKYFWVWIYIQQFSVKIGCAFCKEMLDEVKILCFRTPYSYGQIVSRLRFVFFFCMQLKLLT